MTKRTGQRWAVSVGCCALVAASLGCRNHAYNDVYRQKMAGEIRILEDQLYDADYQNRVLRDKLEREAIRNRELAETRVNPRLESRATDGGRSRPKAAPKPDPVPDTTTPTFPQQDAPDIDFPEIDPGDPIDPETLEPAPGGPEPPGKSDLEMPQIDPGEVLPPPSPNGSPEKPPGQILLPDAVKATTPEVAPAAALAAAISIHPGLSSTHVFDDATEGLFLVVDLMDHKQQPLDLEKTTVEGTLEVIAIDPAQPPRTAQVGHWKFNEEQFAKLARGGPASGVQVPVQWQGRKPKSNEVIVQVKLSTKNNELATESTLKLKAADPVAEWMPRGTNTRR